MSAPRYMQFEVTAYLGDTTHLRRCQHGSYIKLLLWYWQAQEPLPDDDDLLAQIALCTRAEWRKDRKILQRFFTVEGGVWRHKRVDAEIERCADRIKKARENADKAGEAHRRNAEARKSLKNIDQSEPAGSDPVTGRLSNQNQNQNQKVEEKENTNLPHQNPTAPREDGAEAPGRGKLVVVDFSKVGKLVDTAKRLGVSPIDIAEAVQGSEKPGIKHPAAYLARVLADRYAHKLQWDTIDEFDLPTIRSAIAGDEAVIARIADAYTRRRMVMGSARR